MRVIDVYALICPGPDIPFLILIQATDEIASNAVRIFGIVPENPETISVKSVQAINGSKPQEAILILQTAGNTVIGKAVFYKIVFEIKWLCMKRPDQDAKRE
jgi:hypothetical protein